MRQPFFITGLPRSRTTWLANLFTTGTQFCHHDLLARVKDMNEFSKALVGGVGDSDTGLIPLFAEVSRMFPLSRWLLVLRDPQDCLNAIQAATAGTEWEDAAREAVDRFDMAAHHEMVCRMIADARVQVIQFEELDDYGKMLAAWRWLCPNKDFSGERFDLLKTMRIQPVFQKIARPTEAMA